MTRMAVYLLMTVLMAIYGGYTALRSLQAVRKPRKYPDALMYWDERPSGLQGDDLMNWLGINTHRLALLGIAAISVVVIVRDARGASDPFAGGWDTGILMSMLAYITAGLIAFFAGFTLFGPVAEYMAGYRHYAASESGLLIAGRHFPWDTFSHFDLDARRKRVTIWSASLPGAAALVAAFPDAGEASRLAEILKAHLPGMRPAGMKFEPWAFPMRMLLLCIPFVAAGWLLMVAPAPLSLTVNLLLMWLLMFMGGQLISRQIYGGKGRTVEA